MEKDTIRTGARQGASVAEAAGVARVAASTASGPDIRRARFGETMDGLAVDVITLTNGSGASVQLLTYGATVMRLLVPDRHGQLGDVVLGFDNLRQYELQSPYFGSTIGRVGNRIAKGQFAIGSRRFAVAVNNDANHLHGGFRGYDKRLWTADAAMTADGPSVRFTLIDPDGCEGYPGEVRVTVIYSLTAANALKIQYFATADQTTPINLTNHTYFNLADGGKSSVLGHVLRAWGEQYVPVDSTSIPTGELANVEGMPIDFTTAKPIGQDLQAMGGSPVGYDHTIVLANATGDLAKAIEVTEPLSGRTMAVWTTEPGVQFYSGNYLDGSITGRDSAIYAQHHGLALETQHFPDSVNHPHFPPTLLHPGEVYRQITEYRFGTVA